MSRHDPFPKKILSIPEARPFCTRCLKSLRSCLCAHIHPIENDVHFVFLMHRKEQRDRAGTGTGRLSHLMLKGSHLFVGIDFERETQVQTLLQDTDKFACVLYPGATAMDVSSSQGMEEFKCRAGSKPLLVFVLDGSWPCARKIVTQTPSLAALPRLSFSTGRTSNYGFKRQPRTECLSTLEAVHELLCLFETAGVAYSHPKGAHQDLVSVFEKLVAFQSSFSPKTEKLDLDI